MPCTLCPAQADMSPDPWRFLSDRLCGRLQSQSRLSSDDRDPENLIANPYIGDNTYYIKEELAGVYSDPYPTTHNFDESRPEHDTSQTNYAAHADWRDVHNTNVWNSQCTQLMVGTQMYGGRADTEEMFAMMHCWAQHLVCIQCLTDDNKQPSPMARCIGMLDEVRLMHAWCPALWASERYAIRKIFRTSGTQDTFSLAFCRDAIALACVRDDLILKPVPDRFYTRKRLDPAQADCHFV